MQAPEIIYTGKGKDRHIAITDELRAYLRQSKDKKTVLARTLGVSRPTLDRLLSECGIAKRETKKQKTVRRLAETLTTAISHAETKERTRIIKQAAKEQAKRNLLDRARDHVKGKDGQPINYNGELLDALAMSDISLMNQAKESPQGNLAFRAQVMALQQEERRAADRKSRQAMLTRISKQRDQRVKEMRRHLTDKGIYLDMLDTMLETWGLTWELMKIAEWNWKHDGGYSADTQITAQAQVNDRPNQLFETYRNAIKAYNEADQKLRAACCAYYKLVNGDDDEENALTQLWATTSKDDDED